MTIIRTIAIITALTTGAPALAQQSEVLSSEVADGIAACRTIVDGSARLACFDTTTKRFVEARQAKQIVILDRADVRKAKRGLFGFSLPRIRLFGGTDEDEPEVREIESTVAGVRPVAGDRWVMSLADDTVWQTTDGVSLIPRAGMPIKVEAGILGSYNARIGSYRSVKVKRVK